ncbi:MAG: hypothetical protein SVW57_03770 [Thermodesulfobacteriota bacterium]|nr:hypothetical protein [Thermodesulfobacteriota bacterium]
MRKKAIALLSGGLDSVLAIRLIQMQGIEVVAFNVISPFSPFPKKGKEGSQAVIAAKELGVELKVVCLGIEYLRIIEHPQFGYGRNLNPCIDCRIYTLNRAKEFMDEIGASFIVTGEVLGQRPMSQTKDKMELIERECKLSGLIVRPLSAKLLPVTIPENDGLLDRERLFDISGRTRKVQLQLAEQLNIHEFSAPAGGCMLTDEIFARRLKDLFTHKRGYTIEDVYLLRLGRHFRLNDTLKILVGRNDSENVKMRSLLPNGYASFSPLDFPGPHVISDGEVGEDEKHTIGMILCYYSHKVRFPAMIKHEGDNMSEVFGIAELVDEEFIKGIRI